MSIKTRPMTNDEAFDEWQTQLLKEAINHRHAVWSIGDLLLEGEKKFDDARFMQALEATKLTIETLTNYKSLAKCFPIGSRRLNLGVSHHEAVRSLDEPTRKAMLDLVERHEISRENLRDRVQAYKGGDLEALLPKWRQKNKVTEVEDHAARENDDDDKPVFDSTDAGVGMAGDRSDDGSLKGIDLSDVNQVMLDALTKAEKAFSHENVSFANLERLSAPRLRALGERIIEVSAAVDAAQENAFKRQRPAASAKPVSSTSDLKEDAEVVHG